MISSRIRRRSKGKYTWDKATSVRVATLAEILQSTRQLKWSTLPDHGTASSHFDLHTSIFEGQVPRVSGEQEDLLPSPRALGALRRLRLDALRARRRVACRGAVRGWSICAGPAVIVEGVPNLHRIHSESNRRVPPRRPKSEQRRLRHELMGFVN